MTRGIKIGIAVFVIAVALPTAAVVGLFFILTRSPEPSPVLRREVALTNHGALIIDGDVRGRSEHGTSPRAGYRPPGAAEIEWFGDVSDGIEPSVYFAEGLVVIIDAPSASLFVRNSKSPASWKTLTLVFPNDLGPFPISYYADLSSLTLEEV